MGQRELAEYREGGGLYRERGRRALHALPRTRAGIKPLGGGAAKSCFLPSCMDVRQDFLKTRTGCAIEPRQQGSCMKKKCGISSKSNPPMRPGKARKKQMSFFLFHRSPRDLLALWARANDTRAPLPDAVTTWAPLMRVPRPLSSPSYRLLLTVETS